MAITAQDIEQKTFSEAKKHGYDTDEVDDFLDQIASEVGAMLAKIKELHDRLQSSEQQLASAQAQVAQLKEQAAAPAPAPQVIQQPAQPVVTASERQISQVLIVAQQSADNMIAEARQNADNIRNEADQKAREVIRQALAEKQRELEEIDRLKQSREDFRSEYKKLLQHFIDDADAVFPERALGNGAPAVAAPQADYSTPAPQPAPNATVFAPAMGSSTSVFDDFGDLD